jgi:hypothetical protein
MPANVALHVVAIRSTARDGAIGDNLRILNWRALTQPVAT